MLISNVKHFINNGTLVFTLTSNGYKYFTLNLVENLKRANISWKLCIICADKDSYQFFRRQTIPAILATTLIDGSGPNISPFGSRQFQRLNRLKLELLSSLVSFPEVVKGVYMDGDIAVYNDFLPDILSRLDEGGLYFQCDEGSRDPCSGDTNCVNVCTGLIAWSHGVSPTLFSVPNHPDLWKKQQEDQVFVNARLRDEGTAFKTLPRDLYPNGQFLRLYSPDSELKRVAKLLHYNYTVGMDKQRRMKQNGDWLSPL
jgi:hypothetical protein